MTLGSLFDGSGGFPLAGAMHGITPIWASEIEPYPIAVSHYHLPDMLHLGNVVEVDGSKIPPVDIVTFGSPCQDMSIAGARKGMKHTEHGADDTTRSGLFYEAIRIMKEMREATNGKYPAYAVWKNVPGAFSSNKGEDFRCVLEELAKISDPEVSVPLPEKGKWLPAGEIVGDGYSIAWRLLDAKYWGVPQRRKRIYLVLDLRGERAREVLFEREGVRGYFAKGRPPWEGIAEDAQGSPATDDREGESADSGVGRGLTDAAATYSAVGSVPYTLKIRSGCDGGGKGALVQADKSATLATKNDQYLFQPVPVLSFKPGKGTHARSLGISDAVSPTLSSFAGGNTVPDVVYDARGNGDGSCCPTLTGDHENRVTDYTAVCVGNGQLHQTELGDKAGALNCMHDQQAIVHTAHPPRKYIVRRLTPLECNRLQGFPDGWGTLPEITSMASSIAFWERVRRTFALAMGKKYIPFKNEAAAIKWYNKLRTDTAEYKMWGNGIALPCASFVIQRIMEVNNTHG